MAKRRSATTAGAPTPPEATFIFRGTVVSARTSTVPEITADANTLVVRVDEVVAAPPALARTAGREITVVVPRALRAGEQADFYAGSVSFGDEVAVRAIRTDPVASSTPRRGFTAARAAAAPLPAAGNVAVDPVQAHRDLLLKRSLDGADVVVAGTVTEVRMAPEIQERATPATAAGGRRASRRGAAPATPTPRRPISEHDPIWYEAVVNVDSVEKGATGQQKVVVRFPGSNDVRWRNYPKLRPGQQGVFMLNQESAPPVAAAGGRRMRRGAARAQLTMAPVIAAQGTSIQPMGEHPINTIERVRQLLSQPTVAERISERVAPRLRRASKSRAAKKRKPSRRAAKKK